MCWKHWSVPRREMARGKTQLKPEEEKLFVSNQQCASTHSAHSATTPSRCLPLGAERIGLRGGAGFPHIAYCCLAFNKLSTFVESTSATPVSTNDGKGEFDSRSKSVESFSDGG